MKAWRLNGAAIALCLCAGLSAAHAGWQDDASPYDVKRFSLLEESKSRGLSEAQSGPDAALVHAVVDAAAVSASEGALMGNWRCRTIKLGGMTADVVYSWFRCRVSERDGALEFEKVSGSQKLNGRLYANESGGYVLLGALSAKGEPAHRYSGNNQAAGAQATPDDVIGLLEATGRSTARIEFPYPVQESVFDVIELQR
ncbi:MAG: DUF4893 domain-containing protein [Rhizomicrobium sp.]|jgi:hypothetical protein